LIGPLILKEFKDLMRDPRIWVPFVITALILPVIGLVIGGPIRGAMEEAIRGKVKVGLVDSDGGNESRALISWFFSEGMGYGLNTTLIDSKNRDEIIDIASDLGLDLVIVIEEGFTESIIRGLPAKVTVINLLREISFLSGATSGVRAVNALKDYLGRRLLRGTGVRLEVVKNPVVAEYLNYLESKGIIMRGDPGTLMGSLGMASFFLPLILMIISVTVIQMSATSMAVENEERTLETLLTFPISRLGILGAKLLGAFSVSMIGSIFNFIGFIAYFYIFSFYMSPPSSMPLRADAEEAGMNTLFLLISGPGISYIFVSMVATLLFMASLGIMIGALSRDVRIASTLTGPLSMAVFIPGYYVAFVSSGSIHPILRTLFYVIPFTQPVIMSRDLVAAKLPIETPVYLLASFIMSLCVIYVTAKLFSLETLSNIQRKLSRIRRR